MDIIQTNVYMDNSSSTRLDEKVWEAMKPYFFETYAVATSDFGYSMGIDAKETLENARKSISEKIGANEKEIIFTSGATESSNLAIKGSAWALKEKKGNHIITSKTEDFPVLNSIKLLEKKGFEVTYLDVNENGFIDIEQLQRSIKDSTILVSVQHANQEIGTVQDIEAIGNICKEKGVLFHTDATHTFMRLPIDLNILPVDLISISAHTIHGPKGIGALYIREKTPLVKIIDGGFQEFNLRAGVENIPGAVGFAKAAELITNNENENLKNMRDKLTHRMLNEIENTTLNGHPQKRTPQNANITFHFVEGESITLHLDMRGFAVSTGSACFSRSLEASHVILGIGGNHERAHGSVRFTLSRYNSMNDVDAIVDALKEIISELRKISPLGKD